MTGVIFSTFFIERFKILIAAILIYVMIFALLTTTKIFGPHGKVNGLVALLAAIIVSFSGVVTYAISYAINWFVIIFFIVFLGMLLLMFLGVKPADISKAVSGKTAVYIAIAFGILFLGILVNSFFAVNNSFNTNNHSNNSYQVNTNYNIGFGQAAPVKKSSPSFWDRLNANSDIVYMALFFIGIGVFILLLGR